MIIRRGSAPSKHRSDPDFGSVETIGLSEAGGIKQYGAHLEVLQPGAKSSTRHWHEKEDEFMFVVAGEVTVIENDGAHVLQPGDVACWPAGVENAHHAINRSAAPCTYLIVGTKLSHDVCHYPVGPAKSVAHSLATVAAPRSRLAGASCWPAKCSDTSL